MHAAFFVCLLPRAVSTLHHKTRNLTCDVLVSALHIHITHFFSETSAIPPRLVRFGSYRLRRHSFCSLVPICKGRSYLQSWNCSTSYKPHDYGSRLRAHGLRMGRGPNPTRSLSPNLAPRLQVTGGVRVRGGDTVGQSKWRCGIMGLVRQRLFALETPRSPDNSVRLACVSCAAVLGFQGGPRLVYRSRHASRVSLIRLCMAQRVGCCSLVCCPCLELPSLR